MRKLLVALLLLLYDPVPEEVHRAFLPIVGDGEPPYCSQKQKCLSRALAPCSALDDVCATWDYGITARGCDNADRVVYLDSLPVYESWIWQESPPSKTYMIFNEPDLAYWAWGNLDNLTTLGYNAVTHWPDAEVVGPCIAGDIDWLVDYLQLYYHKYGEKWPTAAICGHC